MTGYYIFIWLYKIIENQMFPKKSSQEEKALLETIDQIIISIIYTDVTTQELMHFRQFSNISLTARTAANISSEQTLFIPLWININNNAFSQNSINICNNTIFMD